MISAKQFIVMKVKLFIRCVLNQLESGLGADMLKTRGTGQAYRPGT